MRFHFIRYQQNLDEFTFEGRNKSYGAYVLRKAYLKRISFALYVVCISAIVATIFVKIYFYASEAESERQIDLSQYDGFDLRLQQNVLPELPKGIAPKPKTEEKPKTPPKETPKEVVKEQVQKTTKVDYTKITNTKTETAKVDTLAKNGLSKADSTLAANAAESKRLDSLKGLNGTGKNSMMLNNRLGGKEEFIAWVQQHFVYPKTNRLQFDCTIYVSFCINADGTLTDVKITKEVSNKEYNIELLRVVKSSPIWKVNAMASNTPCVFQQYPIKIHATPQK